MKEVQSRIERMSMPKSETSRSWMQISPVGRIVCSYCFFQNYTAVSLGNRIRRSYTAEKGLAKLVRYLDCGAAFGP